MKRADNIYCVSNALNHSRTYSSACMVQVAHFGNRYDNVLVFEEINRLSREILVKIKDIVQKLGYELIFADTDSIY
jgi:hypothetical protein